MISSWTSSLEAGAVSLAKPLPIGSAESAVLDFVGGYSSQARIAGAAVLAKLRGRTPRITHVIARIDDLAAHQRAWAGGRVPFAGVYAQDDAMSFEHGGAAFVVENLLPQDFSKRLADWRAGRGIAFGHEAVSYHAAGRALHDPANALGEPGLRLLHPGRNLGEAFDTVLRGWIEARAGGLEAGPDFTHLETRVLAGAAGRRTSQWIAKTLVQRLASLPANRLPMLFRSNLVSTSLRSAPGFSGAANVRNFTALRGALGTPVSDASIWLALLLAPEPSDPTAAAIESPDRFATLRSRAAFAHAREVVAHPAFHTFRRS